MTGVPDAVTRCTSTVVPAVCVGAVALIVVPVRENELAACVPNSTPVTEARSVPTMVTVVPTAPVGGVSEVTVGTAGGDGGVAVV